MQTYILAIHDRAIRAESADTLIPRTGIGVDEIALRIYSQEWLGFDLSMAIYNGEALEEQSLTVTEVEGKDWLAESTVSIPADVLEEVGPLGVTVHGTDENDCHIITERAFPLEVVQEGDEEAPPPVPPELSIVTHNLPQRSYIEVSEDGSGIYAYWWHASGKEGIIFDSMRSDVIVRVFQSGISGKSFYYGVCPEGSTVANCESNGHGGSVNTVSSKYRRVTFKDPQYADMPLGYFVGPSNIAEGEKITVYIDLNDNQPIRVSNTNLPSNAVFSWNQMRNELTVSWLYDSSLGSNGIIVNTDRVDVNLYSSTTDSTHKYIYGACTDGAAMPDVTTGTASLVGRISSTTATTASQPKSVTHGTNGMALFIGTSSGFTDGEVVSITLKLA